MARSEDSGALEPKTPGRAWTFLWVVVMLGLAALAVLRYTADRRLRDAAAAFARNGRLGELRPDATEAMSLEPAGDLAAAVAVRATLEELDTRRQKEEATPAQRQARASLRERRRPLLGAASALMVDAAAVRPGWFNPRLLLGEISRASATGASGDWRGRSRDALRTAAASAPGLDVVWTQWARACLEDWPTLDPSSRREVPAILRRALRDPAFVGEEFARVIDRLGPTPALELLPNAPRPLQIALEKFGARDDVAAAAAVFQKLEAAERRQRAADLQAVERAAFRNVETLWSACMGWMTEHRITDFDDRAGRSQVARLLELWPPEPPGSWNSDPRAEMVTFFLNGRAEDAPRTAMIRSVDHLSDVPPAIRARVRLIAGDPGGAQELAASASSDGSFEWASYFVDLARFELERKSPEGARAALESIPPGTGEEDCDVLLIRRGIAEALSNAVALTEVQRRLSPLTAGPIPREAWTSSGTLPLCVDPANRSGKVLRLTVRVEKPALIAYGWDGGRAGAVMLSGTRTIRVPLANIEGRRMFTLTPLMGGPATPVASSVGPG